MDHAFIGVLEQLGVFARHAHRGAVVVDSFHPCEQFGVERDRVAMCGQLGADFGVDLVEPVGGVRTGQREEDACHAAEHAARFLERDDGVFEGRSGRIVDDRLDLGLLDRHALFEGGHVIVFRNGREIGRLERQAAVGGEIAGALRHCGRGGVRFCHGVQVFPICGGASGEQCGGCDGGHDLGLHSVPLRIERGRRAPGAKVARLSARLDRITRARKHAHVAGRRSSYISRTVRVRRGSARPHRAPRRALRRAPVG